MAVVTPTARGAASRSRLLSAAGEELVSRDGQLEVASVAERARVSVGLIYRYFGSRAGLVAAVVDDFYDRLDSAAMAVNPAPDADWAQREHLRTELYVGFHYDEPLAAIILARLGREPDVAAVEARRIARHINLAARNIERGQQGGEIPEDLDPGIAGALVLGGMRQVLGEVLAREEPPPRERVVDEIWRLVVAAVRFRPREPKEQPDA
jgi:AcrR family transcriptional regulator